VADRRSVGVRLWITAGAWLGRNFWFADCAQPEMEGKTTTASPNNLNKNGGVTEKRFNIFNA
jgi:hypothetical protein